MSLYMSIIKFLPGIFLFSSLFKIKIFPPTVVRCKNTFILIENKLETLKIPAKTFRTHDTYFNNIYFFYSILLILFKSRSIKLLNHI